MKNILLLILLWVLTTACTEYRPNCEISHNLFDEGNSINGIAFCHKYCYGEPDDEEVPIEEQYFCTNPESEYYMEGFTRHDNCGCMHECNYDSDGDWAGEFCIKYDELQTNE